MDMGEVGVPTAARPTAPPRPPGSPDAEGPGSAPRTERYALLLVEDDPGDALLVEELLADTGLDVDLLWVRTLAEARRALAARAAARTTPDIVLLDLHLPDAGGLEVVEAVLAAQPGAAVLVLTGLADGDAGVAAVTAGAQDYLIKGQVDPELLSRALRYAVQRKRAEQATQALVESQVRAEENARLERGLLPTPMVSTPGLEVTARYRPGRERALLGGDFHDVVQTSDGQVHAVIGDVSGHGPDEAALGVCLRIAWRALTLSGLSGAPLLDLLEQLLVAERAREDVFATVCTVTLRPGDSAARVVSAGHPFPLLLADRRATPAAIDPGMALGLLPGARRWPENRVEVPAQGGLLLYTDGLIEGRIGPGPERLGTEGLAALVESLVRPADEAPDPAELVDLLVDAVERLDGGRISDDLAVLRLSWKRWAM